MLKNFSGFNRTRRTQISPKVKEVRETYALLAQGALFRAYPSMKNFGAEICLLDAGDMLELFWSLLDLGGEVPGGWHQVQNLTLVFERAGDGKVVKAPLSDHIAGFHAWYRMRGGMAPILPNSFYLNLEKGEWSVYIEGVLQDVRALCLFADAFDDLFHYSNIKKYYDQIRQPMLEAHHITEDDLTPEESFRIFAGTLSLAEDRLGVIDDKQANRLHHVVVRYEDVLDVPVPTVSVPEATPLDPVNYLREKLYYLQEQSIKHNFCPYYTCNDWAQPANFNQPQFVVNERIAYFYIEGLAPLFRATGDPEVYRTTRKWYEWIARNIWPAPGGGKQITTDRVVYGSALQCGGMSDAVCTFAEIDGDPRWVAPLREGLLDWPMHPTLPRPLMDQDSWGNEEMNTTGTYNMCTHFALACWRAGHVLNDEGLMAKGEYILNNYTFPGEQDGIWSYRPGNHPSHHYDMYLKWQLSRLLFTGADRWTKDEAFLARMRRATDSSFSHYAKEENGELLFWDWTHYVNATHPANAARHGACTMEAMLALVLYVDEGYLEPMEQTLRGLYRLLMLPEVDCCWHGSWFHMHGELLSLALHGIHVEGNTVEEMRLVRVKETAGV
ncbi:MAG: hypothetical protein ACYDBB_09525 [Armatimonadota bacterium]